MEKTAENGDLKKRVSDSFAAQKKEKLTLKK